MGKSGKRGDNPLHDRKIFWVNFQEKRGGKMRRVI